MPYDRELKRYVRTTTDEFMLLANYGYGHGWEEETSEASYKEIRQRLKEYRENAPEYRYKIKISRKPNGNAFKYNNPGMYKAYMEL